MLTLTHLLKIFVTISSFPSFMSMSNSLILRHHNFILFGQQSSSSSMSILGKQFSGFNVPRTTWRASYNPERWTPPPEFLIESVCRQTHENVHFSQVPRLLLMLLVPGPHWEMHSLRPSRVKHKVAGSQTHLCFSKAHFPSPSPANQ